MNTQPGSASFRLGTLALALAALAACAGRSSVMHPAPSIAGADSVDVGYGRASSRDVNGPVAGVGGGEARRYSSRSVAEMLSGRFPGVEVLQRRNGGISIRIRGQRSLTSNQEPLYVLDGVPISGGGGLLSDLNPHDIHRIEVLKGGAAAAVYGSRGANGVILISLRQPGS